ncbi:MAG: LysE family translocator, partial [Flavobacteriaceae bacterium]
MVELLISFCIASAGMAISPGPDNVYVFTQSITNGTSYGIATTAGLIAGCIVHTTLVAFGVSAVLLASETTFFIIKMAGAIYLLYLAFKVYKAGNTLMI